MAWAPDYTTVAALKAYVRIPALDTQDDVQLALAVTAASRAIDNATNRQFGLVAAPEARYYTAEWQSCDNRYTVEIDDVMIVTGASVVADSTGDGDFDLTVTAYDFKPVNAASKGKPYTQLWIDRTVSLPVRAVDGLQVTARWGWSDVPDTIEQATLIQASRFFTRREAPFGVAGSPESGSEMRLLERVDPDVKVMVQPYYRWWGAR